MLENIKKVIEENKGRTVITVWGPCTMTGEFSGDSEQDFKVDLVEDGEPFVVNLEDFKAIAEENNISL